MEFLKNFNLKGLLQDEEFLLGAGLLSAGSQGQSLGQAALPQMLRAANISNAFQERKRKTDFRDAVGKIDQTGFSDIEKALIRFDPIKGYEMISKNRRAANNKTRTLTPEEVSKGGQEGATTTPQIRLIERWPTLCECEWHWAGVRLDRCGRQRGY